MPRPIVFQSTGWRVRTQKRTDTLVESGVDCITSSYGVGPTDENGRPLFGLRALRRSNTNKQLTDDVLEVKQEEQPQTRPPPQPCDQEPVCDARGRPLFGGLKALRAKNTTTTTTTTTTTELADDTDMPEQTTTTQLRELVERHEKVVKETNGPQDQPRQKPKAKLRDSFILQEDEQASLGHLAEINNLNRGLSLRSIIQKHENISGSGGVVRNEMESSHTVVTSRTAVSSDGTISHTRDVIEGEVSARNGEEPVGKVTRSQYTYKSPRGDDEGVNKVTTTTTSLGRRLSGPKIEEIEDVPQRKSSLKSALKRSSITEVSEETSERVSSRKGSLRKSPSEEEDDAEKVTSKISSTAQRFTSSRQSESRSKTSSPNLRRQKSSEEESSAEEKEKQRKTVVRGDSVRALQHKFQQATENAANSAPRSQTPRAGLILRTSSFTKPDLQDAVSSTLKQSTSLSADKGSGRQSPEKVSRRDSPVSDSNAARRESLSKAASGATTRKESSSSETTSRVTETSSKSSFLDNRRPVTGVQDILERMRNADLVNESTDTDADREARALLNKFLGASVILQGMEQGMRANGTGPMLDGTPGSAALVSSVEKQRKATTRQKEEDIENIWDEQILKTLLEQCTDYEGRRKLRARLRTVMAEHKACADLVAVTGDSVGDASQHAGECHVSQHASPSDSGTESGEEFRLLSPEILAEVQSALTRLEAALPGLDPARQEALVRLVTRLQSCLKLQPPPSVPPPPPPDPPAPNPAPPPPQPPVKRYANRRQRNQRHTVGVSKEELADARRWFQETRQQSRASSGVTPEPPPSVESVSTINLNEPPEEKPLGFRPVKFVPNQNKTNSHVEPPQKSSQPNYCDQSDDTGDEPVVLSAALTYSLPQEVTKVDSGSSLLEYDPSLVLFTPAQSVQIAVHKAAINKQISREESKRENNKREESYDSEDGDESSVEDEQSMATTDEGLQDAISSAQRLLQMASDNNNKSNRFQEKSVKKQKMKRANTADIPRPNFYEMEGLPHDARDGVNNSYQKEKFFTEKNISTPHFQPKTESDMKFLAFLKEANKNDAKTGSYNPSARGGQPWTNRFVNLKTAFESSSPQTKQTPPKKNSLTSMAEIWEKNATKDDSPAVRTPGHRTPQPLQNKLPWSSQQEEEGVVIGSLTVKPSPGLVNKFSHAPKSAFKPIEKKPTTYNQPQKLIIQPQGQSKQNNKNSNLNNKAKPKEDLVFKAFDRPQKQKIMVLTPPVIGTVKQLVTQKFCGDNAPSKPIIKQYPVIQDMQFNSASTTKQHPFVEHNSKPVNTVAPVNHVPPSQSFPNSIALTQKQFSNHQDPDFVKPVKIPQKTPTTTYKDGGEFSPPKQYINSPPLSKHYAPFEYPTETKFNNSFPSVLDHQNKQEVQWPLSEAVPVPYYSQEPAYVQHTTFAQPVVEYSPQPMIPPHSTLIPQSIHQEIPKTSEFIEDNRNKYLQPQYNGHFNQPEQYVRGIQDQYTNGKISPPKIQIRNTDLSLADSHTLRELSPQHRFTEESLVPNPLHLSEVYRPGSLECSPYSPPKFDQSFDSPEVTQINKSTLPPFTNNFYENHTTQGYPSSSKASDFSPSMKQYLNIPYNNGHDISPVISNTSKSPYFESVSSSTAPSPQFNQEDFEENEISLSEGAEMQSAVTRVMGQSQCQKAVTVTNRTKHRYEDDDRGESQSLLRTLLRSPRSPNMERRQSSEKLPTYSEPPQPQKSPLLDKSLKNRLLPDTYSYSVTAKPPAIVTNQSLGSKQSSVVSAFRPLVSNLSKPAESEIHRLPPVPSSPSFGRKPESDSRLIHSSPKVSLMNSLSSQPYDSELLASHSRVSPSRSPSFPNVLQKSESWHQLVKEQMVQGRHPPPKSPRLSKTKSSHTLAFPKQFEAHLTPETLAVKQSTVDQYMKSSSKQLSKSTKQTYKQKKTVSVLKLDDNLSNVDEAFETLFQEVAKKK